MTDRLTATEDVRLQTPNEPGGRLVVFARTPSEMKSAQDDLITWAKGKLTQLRVDYEDLQTNYEIAKKNKWRTDTLKRHAVKAKEKIEYYEKVKAALEAGFSIVPNMDIDVFAIRTSKKAPRRNDVTSRWNQNPSDQVTDRPELGEGKYVATQALIGETKRDITTKDGSKEVHTHRWADEFADVDFPFKFAKPQILEATGAAMEKLIFDEIGILPRRRVSGDPMIIGRILYKEGYSRKAICFCVAWFVDTDDI